MLAVLVACGGGGDGESGGSGGASRAEPTPRDAVVEAWTKGGYRPSAMAAVTVTFGKDCHGGTVNGVDVLLCNFPSADDAKLAEGASVEWVKDAPTATTFVSGTVMVAVADRKKADPSGKTINQLMKLAPK